MTRALRILYANAYYHVTCRGNERKAIFRDDTDRSVFLDKLNSSREIYGVEIHCYVLMNNHFHLVVETPRRHSYGVRLLNLVNLDAGAVGLIDGRDGATAAIVCTGDSLSRDRTW